MSGLSFASHRQRLCTLLGTVLALALVSPAALSANAADTSAALDFPNQPVKLVVAFAPGTGSDALSRMLAEAMAGPLGQAIVVENRPGGGGIVGTDHVARSAPDGYTMTMGTTSTLITNPYLNPAARYTVQKDFKPVTGLARTNFVIVTANTPEAPKTLSGLVDRLKAGNANYASSGMGTIVHLTGERFVRAAGAKATHIPYKGSAQSVSDVAAGVTLFTAETMAAALPLVRGGKLRALAVTSAERTQALPNVPTVIESGYPDFAVYSWFGLMVPAGTPDAIVQKLDEAARTAMKSPAMARRLETLGFESLATPSAEFAAFIEQEIPAWTNFLKSAGIKLE